MTKNNLVAEEQKGYKKKTQGCKELRVIVITSDAVQNRKDLDTVYIYYQKSFYSHPTGGSWII